MPAGDEGPSTPPAPVVRAVLALRAAWRRLSARLFPAELVLFELSSAFCLAPLLGLAARHRIPERLAKGPQTAEALATELELNPDALHRALRALATVGVFALDSQGRFRNTRLSRALREGAPGQVRSWALYCATPSLLAAWADLDQTVKTGRNAFQRVHGEPVWSWFERHPEEREIFAHAIHGISARDAAFVASPYPFHELGTLCDVGGGVGGLLAELLARHPNLKGVLCDSAGVLASARELFARRGLLDRVELAPGDFFHAVPKGADAYLLKSVLHDWDDATALRILGTCRQAMSPGARLLVVELLLERHQASGVAPFSDVQMMVVCQEGRERSRAELERLLRASGLRPARVFPGPLVSVLEARAD